MLIYMILLQVLSKATVSDGNVGTTIFYNRHTKEQCWNAEDIVRLRARQKFDQLFPTVNLEEVNAKFATNALALYKKSLKSVESQGDDHTSILLKEAMADTIGAHLRSEMLPRIRFAYYAGYVPYRHTRKLHDFFDEIKSYLNTQGLGWQKPKRMSQKWSNVTVAKVSIGAGSLFSPCASLITKRDSNSCIHLPIPKHDNDRAPSVVALPFKSGGLVNLAAPGSENMLLRYYTTASKCILTSSPVTCRHSDFVSFNNELWHWMKREVAPHLKDEKLYVAYGGVFRIAAAVQNYGKGLLRRNIFEYKDAGTNDWNPWQRLTQSYIQVDTDWSPSLYVGLVFLIAVTIYLVQIGYSYMFGDAGCNCNPRAPLSIIAHSTGQKSAHPTACYYVESKRQDKPGRSSITKCINIKKSERVIRTEKVYDLNENTETEMAVITKEEEASGADSSGSCSEKEEVVVARQPRPKSPPKLQASISQMTLHKKPHAQSRSPMYSTSSIRRPKKALMPNLSDSMWSESSGSSSSRSESSSHTKSRHSTRSPRSGSSRDLAWARRVISKHTSKSLT